MNHWRTNPWLVCLLPFVVFMLVGSLEPTPTAEGAIATKSWLDLGIEYRQYPLIYTAKILLTLAAMMFVWPGYRQYTRRLTWLGVAVGVIGAAVWIALATWQRQWMPLVAEKTGIEWFKTLGQRSAFNPLTELSAQPALAYGFLAVRLLGLAVVVPVIEEFFQRGFLMRFAMVEKWWEVPFGNVNRLAVVAGTAVPMLMHPQEAVAALVWFSAVTWLMIRSRSIWDCVLAHAVTNLLLGVYVIASGQWWLM
ncbi:MAG TPA: CAAX prenyl protease-related protein [Pirellulales bacterium]|nr:CAAX prenyl protease-related protein [Pirellulales bacterium]